MSWLARWGAVAAAVLMGAALLATVWSTHRSVQNASEILLRGQADSLLDGIRLRARPLHRRPSGEDLAAILDELEPDGLLYVAALDARGRIYAEAGTRPGSRAELERAAAAAVPGIPIEQGGVAHAVFGPHRRGRRPSRRRAARRRRRGPARLFIEFSPQRAEDLRTSAGRTLGIGGLAAGAFLLVAIGLVRWFVRREALERQLEQERRLASLGQMSAVLAHEIRNPLASLKGNAQLLAREMPEGEKRAAKARRVVDEAVRLEQLTNDLLEFARSGDIHRTDTDPSELLRESAAAAGEDRIDLDTTGAPAHWPLDPARIRQVLTNLLQNAAQAGAEPVSASCAKEGERLTFVVRDRGPGIDEQELDKLFEPFFTRRTRGTGLGLAVAKRLVELHGGAITAANHPDGGAVFRVTLPAK